MFVLVLIQFCILLTACVVLLLEARTGDLEAASEKRPGYRAVLYILATVSGATMLIAVADGEWLFALALIPITFLSLLRFSMIAKRWLEGWKLPVITCFLVGIGIIGSLPLMPYPLDRSYILYELRLVDDQVRPPDTIDPEAIDPVRA